MRMLFTDPYLRTLYADWEGVTRLGIAQMRRHSSQHPDDPQLNTLVAELSASYPEFRKWWADHDLATRDIGRKHLRHPVVGELPLDWSVMSWAAGPRPEDHPVDGRSRFRLRRRPAHARILGRGPQPPGRHSMV